MSGLLERWAKALTALAPDAPTDAVRACGAGLLARWGEPHRRYHTTTHLAEVLDALGELAGAGEVDERAAMLASVAAWFHDAVYAVPSTAGAAGREVRGPAMNNEAASAELAVSALSGLGVHPADVDSVRTLVLDTAGHGVSATSGVRAAFQDADLWVLAAGSGRFDRYCAEVREEYAHVPCAAYRTGRRTVLAPLADREHVYRTAWARRRWEAAARANLRRELSRLGG